MSAAGAQSRVRSKWHHKSGGRRALAAVPQRGGGGGSPGRFHIASQLLILQPSISCHYSPVSTHPLPSSLNVLPTLLSAFTSCFPLSSHIVPPTLHPSLLPSISLIKIHHGATLVGRPLPSTSEALRSHSAPPIACHLVNNKGRTSVREPPSKTPSPSCVRLLPLDCWIPPLGNELETMRARHARLLSLMLR